MTREVPTMIRTARLAQVLEHALRAPSVHNTQPWRWRLDGDVIDLFADIGRQLPVTDPDGRDLTISCGVALHHLVVALGHAGHDAYVKRMPDPQDNTHLATITISDAPPDPATARLFGAIGRRHTELRRMRCQPVPVALQAALVDAAHRFDVRMVRANGVREAFNSAFAAAAEHELWTNGHTTALHISGKSPHSRIVDPRPGRTGLSDSRGSGYSELEVPGPPLGCRLARRRRRVLPARDERGQDTGPAEGRGGAQLGAAHRHPGRARDHTTQPRPRQGNPSPGGGRNRDTTDLRARGVARDPGLGTVPQRRRDLATVLMRPIDSTVGPPVESGAGVR